MKNILLLLPRSHLMFVSDQAPFKGICVMPRWWKYSKVSSPRLGRTAFPPEFKLPLALFSAWRLPSTYHTMRAAWCKMCREGLETKRHTSRPFLQRHFPLDRKSHPLINGLLQEHHVLQGHGTNTSKLQLQDMTLTNSHLFILFRKSDRPAIWLLCSPLSKSGLIPATPPNTFVIGVLLVSKPNTHSNVASIAMMRVLKTLLVEFTQVGTFFESRCLRSHSASLSKFSSFRREIIPIL